MSGGGGHVLVRSRNGPHVHLHPRPGLPLDRIVAVITAGIAPVGKAVPEMMRHVRVPIHVIPARIDEHAVVIDAGLPLLGFMKAEAGDVAAVGRHRVQRVGRGIVGRRGTAASQVAAPPLGNERDPAIGQPARIEFVPGAVRQLHQSRTVDAHAENVIAGSRRPFDPVGSALGVGEQDRPPVERQIRRQEAARLQAVTGQATFLNFGILQQIDQLRLVRKRIAQHEHPAAGPRTEAVELVHHVVQAARIVPLDEQQLVEIQQRVTERDLPQCAACGEIQFAALIFPRGVLPGQLAASGLDLPQLLDQRRQARRFVAQAAYSFGQLIRAAKDRAGVREGKRFHLRRLGDGRPPGLGSRLGARGRSDAGLIRRFAQRQIDLRLVLPVDLDFVQGKGTAAGHGDTHHACRHATAAQVDGQRGSPTDTVEGFTVVPVDLDEFRFVGVAGDQDAQVSGPWRRVAVGAVVDHNTVQGIRLSQINLPPRVCLVAGRMKPASARLHPVATAGRVLPGRDAGRPRCGHGRRLAGFRANASSWSIQSASTSAVICRPTATAGSSRSAMRTKHAFSSASDTADAKPRATDTACENDRERPADAWNAST